MIPSRRERATVHRLSILAVAACLLAAPTAHASGSADGRDPECEGILRAVAVDREAREAALTAEIDRRAAELVEVDGRIARAEKVIADHDHGIEAAIRSRDDSAWKQLIAERNSAMKAFDLAALYGRKARLMRESADLREDRARSGLGPIAVLEFLYENGIERSVVCRELKAMAR